VGRLEGEDDVVHVKALGKYKTIDDLMEDLRQYMEKHQRANKS
jgi:succinate dehydrogenase/fumarate reductase-like Fe-S protein